MMEFNFEQRPSDSPLVEGVWRASTEQAGSFISQANSNWEIVVTKFQGKTSLTLRGPETKASTADTPADAEFFGIVFKLGAFVPHLPTSDRTDRNDLTLPEASSKSFWLHGSAWQFPDFENADTFVERLVREDLLTYDPVVDATLQGRPMVLSPRTLQYRFLRATGLTQKTVQQIERARQAMTLLQQGVPILDAVFETGYFDQPHMARSLKHYIGQTPAQLANAIWPE